MKESEKWVTFMAWKLPLAHCTLGKNTVALTGGIKAGVFGNLTVIHLSRNTSQERGTTTTG